MLLNFFRLLKLHICKFFVKVNPKLDNMSSGGARGGREGAPAPPDST